MPEYPAYKLGLRLLSSGAGGVAFRPIARETISYEIVLLHLVEKALGARSRVVYTVRRTLDTEKPGVGDYYELICSIHRGLAPVFRSRELEQQFQKITQLYMKCLGKLEEYETKLMWGGHLELEYNGVKLYDGEVIDHVDRECATRILLEIDKYIDLYLSTLDSRGLLIRKKELMIGGELGEY